MRNQTHKTLLNVLATASSFVLLTAFFLLTGAVFAKDTGASMSKSGLMADDQKFLRAAAQGGMAEVDLGHLAIKKSSSSEVKAFGQRMIDDHSKANERLKALAISKSFALPVHMNAEQKKMKEKLAGLSAADFDRQYMKHMAEDHEKDVAEFQTESVDAKDTDIKEFASSTLPTLKEHLKLAQDLAAKTGASGK
jgi:putative membrane protein